MPRASQIVVKAGGGGALASPPRSHKRKVTLIGTAPTVDHAPWFDESYEIWSHASSAEKWPRVDMAFEMHPECVWRAKHKAHYLKWMQRCSYPLVMLEQYPDIPASERFPRERMFGQCRALTGGTLHYGSHTDFMIQYALACGVTHLALYGIHYVDPVKDGDRLEQLIAVKFWLGVAAGRGVTLEIPEGNPIFSIPKEVYGLESHSTIEKYKARLEREAAVARKPTPWDPVGVSTLVPSDGTDLRKMPPALGLGHKPAPENWERFEMVGA